jgi:hypothetical protein
MYVVKHHWHAVARCFSQAHVSRNDGLEDLAAEEATEIRSDLFRKRGAVVVHSEQDTFDCEGRIYGSAKTHQGVQQLGDTFEC